MVLDLEDAVATAHKEAARGLVADLVRDHPTGRGTAVRVNALGTPWFEDDLRMCANLGSHLTSVIVPKVENQADLAEVDRILADAGDTDLAVQALVETPRGVQSIDEIVTGPRLTTVILGYADLGAALGRVASTAPMHWLYVQDRLLHAARAADIQVVDGPYLGVSDSADFRTFARWTADLGFDGKWVIHPSQIDSATAIFTPSQDRVERARLVLAALDDAESRGAGAAQLDGQMLDEAVAVAARRTLTLIGE
ncbi:citrate lyase beta subunit [Rhodococcus sp. 27YEA15]